MKRDVGDLRRGVFLSEAGLGSPWRGVFLSDASLMLDSLARKLMLVYIRG